MVLFASKPAASSPFHRCVAAMGVALVLLLTAAASSPVLHDHLHGGGDQAAAANHSCAVVLFASGVTAAVAAVWLAAVRVVWRELVREFADVILPPAPRFLRQPERGPPLS